MLTIDCRLPTTTHSGAWDETVSAGMSLEELWPSFEMIYEGVVHAGDAAEALRSIPPLEMSTRTASMAAAVPGEQSTSLTAAESITTSATTRRGLLCIRVRSTRRLSISSRHLRSAHVPTYRVSVGR